MVRAYLSQEYGLAQGGVIDGRSRKVLSLVAITNKLTITVYQQVPAVVLARYGFPSLLLTPTVRYRAGGAAGFLLRWPR